MAVTGFVPTLWASRYTQKLYDSFVWGSLCNRNYEGEIRNAGDTVKVPTTTTNPTISDYVMGTELADPQRISGTTAELNVDQQKYFHFTIHDLERIQAEPELIDENVREFSRAMAKVIDTYLYGIFNTRATADEDLTVTAANTTATDKFGQEFVEKALDAAEFLSKNNIAEDSRFMVVSPEVKRGLEKYFLNTKRATTDFQLVTPDISQEVIKNGYMGKVAGFDVLMTNQVPKTGALHRVICGRRGDVVTLAEQVTHVETYRPENHFSEAWKALHVYGALATNGSKLVRINCTTA